MEEWKDIKGFEGLYQISNLGNIKSLDRIVINRKYKGSYLKPQITYGGYYSIQLRKNKIKHIYYVHRLVATHFLNTQNGEYINHIDENKLNNKYDNLEFVTKSYNTIHSNKGAGFLSRKFDKKEIQLIREMYNNGVSIYKISKDLNDNTGTISNIVNFKTYKNI